MDGQTESPLRAARSLDSSSLRRQNTSRDSSSGPRPETRDNTSPSDQVRDPISESYRSIVEVINRTSNGFKEGKKWKCSASSANHINHHHHRRKVMMTHSRTMTDETRHMTPRETPPVSVVKEDPVVRGRGRAKRLVRQKATNLDDSEENLLQRQCSAEIVDERPRSTLLRVTQGIPRQWTIDTCTGLMPPMPENMVTSPSSGTAYLLRPVSRSSLMSAGGANELEGMPATSQLHVRRLSPGDRPRSPAARSPMREKIKICSNNSSFNHSMDASISSQGATSTGGGSRKGRTLMPGSIPPHQNKRLLRKQRTTESAPMSKSPAFGGSSRYLPRQHSNASAYSAAMPTSYSHQGITLVRGASCSLVDIPTYLGPSMSGGVELAQLCDVSSAICKTVPMNAVVAAEQRKPTRPRLQLDLTRKKNAKSQRKSLSRTVLCVSVTLLTLSVTLVGTMLSVGSKYQDKVIAKQWATLSKNQSRDMLSTEEPFVIIPNDIDLISGVPPDGNGTHSRTNGTHSDPRGAEEESQEADSEIVSIIFPPDLENSADLLDIVSAAAGAQHHGQDTIDDLAIP